MELGPAETRNPTSNARFVVLDSWRGIAALAIAAFHFRRTTGLDGIPLFDNLFLSVDFFFVLSGFVISSAYGKRLLGGFGICKFMWLRFGRVYPLHLAILLAFITMQMIAVYHARGTGWFPAPRESLDTVIGNLLLVHGLNVFPFLPWNKPSWSISVEFCTYVIFALTIVFFGRKTWLLALSAMVASPVFLFLFNHGQNIDATHTYGIVRSLYGFSVGIICHEIYVRCTAVRSYLKAWVVRGFLLELAVLAIVLEFITLAGTSILSLIAPLLFGVVVLTFAMEAGLISRLLALQPFLLLGTLSYSIYMVHMFILSWWHFMLRAVLLKLGEFNMYETVVQLAKNTIFWEGRNYPGMVIMTAVIVAVSYGAYFLIEMPCREWSRKMAVRLFPVD